MVAMANAKDTSKDSLTKSPSWAATEVEGNANAVEARELRSRFSVLSAVGIQFSIAATPLAVGSYLTFILGAGGSPFFFYAFLVAAFGQLLVCTSMAEIASAFPHASGEMIYLSGHELGADIK
jgi:choline transport protein